jgi:hypothetical protein
MGMFIDTVRPHLQLLTCLDAILWDFDFLPIKCLKFAHDEILKNFPRSALPRLKTALLPGGGPINRTFSSNRSIQPCKFSS